MNTENIPLKKFKKYTNEQFHFEFEYPIEWNFQIQENPDELQENKFVIFITGPPESSTGIGYSLLSLWLVPVNKNSQESVKDYIDNLTHRLYNGTSKIIGTRSEQMAHTDGWETEYTVDTFRPLHLPKKYQKLVVEHDIRMVIEKNDVFYDLRFSAGENDYPLLISNYQHAKKTFDFI
jgi:hypothetical protein